MVLLLEIALFPLIAPRWWAHRYPLVTLPLGVLVIVYYVFFHHNFPGMLHTGHEYVSFIALIGSLFVVAGGIHIGLSGELTPRSNSLLLAVGAVLANIVGTTGASMILIRPFLTGNARRMAPFHVVFFIFIVSNCGGALTPIGDPPLFLGYLKGVPFFWTLHHLYIKWIIGIAILLLMFYVLDSRSYRKQPAEIPEVVAEPGRRIAFEGLQNIAFLLMILVAAFIERPIMVRESIMIVAAIGSYLMTPKRIHEKNHFNFHPIQEVAILFAAIFACMVPALDWLSVNADKLGVVTTTHFYWMTGSLSAFLDNAPTYLNFLATGMGLHGLSIDNRMEVLQFAAEHPELLRTISIAAVFFGAATYIGNGPNFMVKAIADHARVKTPSFVEYIYKYSIPVLLPMLVVIYFVVR